MSVASMGWITPGISACCAPFRDWKSNALGRASPSESSLVLLRDFVFRAGVAGSRFAAFLAEAVLVALFAAFTGAAACFASSDFASASASHAFFRLDRLVALRLLSHSA